MHTKRSFSVLLYFVIFLFAYKKTYADSKMDPIRFSMSTNASHITLNEEFEIKITAKYIALNPNLIYVFEGANSFKLKLVLPEGFQKTGGTYSDYVGTELTATKPSISYTIKGKFTTATSDGSFMLLRSHKNATAESDFIMVGQVKFSAFSPDPTVLESQTSRIATFTQEYIPFMSLDQFRAGIADTSRVVYITEKGRSGMFQYDPLNTTSADDSSMILKYADRRYIRKYDGYLSVKWFGAEGDGVTDDTKAIQKAIDFLNPSSVLVYKFETAPKTGGIVYLPKGKYRTTKTLWLTNGVVLKGETGQGAYSQFDNAAKVSSAVIFGDLTDKGWVIQTQSWETKDVNLNSVPPRHVQWNEMTHWRQSDGNALTITSACGVEDLIIITRGSNDNPVMGGIRLCSTTYSHVKNVEIHDAVMGIMIDCALQVKIEDVHFHVRNSGIIVSQSANGVILNNVYINSWFAKNFADFTPAITAPSYLRLDLNSSLDTYLNYDQTSQSNTTGIFATGALAMSITNAVIEGFKFGIVCKDSQMDVYTLYLEGISDTGIITSNSHYTETSSFWTAVTNKFGLSSGSNIFSLVGRSNYSTGGATFKNHNYGIDPLPPFSNVIVNQDIRDIHALLKTGTSKNLKLGVYNNPSEYSTINFNNGYSESGAHRIFSQGMPASNQRAIEISGNNTSLASLKIATGLTGIEQNASFRFHRISESPNERFIGVFPQLAGGEVHQKALSLEPAINHWGSSNYDLIYGSVFEQNLGTGTNWLLNLGTNSSSFYTPGTHTQKFGIKNDGSIFKNGVELKAAASPNIATSVSSTYSQAEIQAILNELRDLKVKMKAANLLAP